MDQSIKAKIVSITSNYEKIIFILTENDQEALDASRFLQNELNSEVINLNLELARLLLPEKESRYPFLIYNTTREIIKNNSSKILILKNIELLFCPLLKLNVIQTLTKISRNYPIIVLWPGEYTNNTLVYATPEHKEYHRTFISNLPVLSYANHKLVSQGGG